MSKTFLAKPHVKEPASFLHDGKPENASQGSSRCEDLIEGGRETSAAHTELRGNAIIKSRVLSSCSNTLRTAKVGVPVVPHAPLRVEEFLQYQ